MRVKVKVIDKELVEILKGGAGGPGFPPVIITFEAEQVEEAKECQHPHGKAWQPESGMWKCVDCKQEVE